MQLDQDRFPDGALDPIRAVVEAALTTSPHLAATDLMVVGAQARDLWHACLGHDPTTRPTYDLDLAVALSSWDSYRTLTSAFPATGSNEIRYRIAGLDVDLLAFGPVEDPTGVVTPPPRTEPVSVWSFDEIFAEAVPLDLGDAGAIRIPSVAGYAAAKLAAWLDRSAYGEYKDAQDIALTMSWYVAASEIDERLFGTPDGNAILESEKYDTSLAAVHALGADIADVIGPTRLGELFERWPGNSRILTANLGTTVASSDSAESGRRAERIDALTRGLEHPR